MRIYLTLSRLAVLGEKINQVNNVFYDEKHGIFALG